MDTNCLGGRRNKQKPQENLKQKQKQNYHYHPQQQQLPQGHTHQHQHHHYLQQNQEQQNYPLDFYQKSTYRTEENLENSIIGKPVMYPGTVSDGSCSSSSANSGNSQQNYINTQQQKQQQQQQQQQNSCKGIIYPHFPPPPDYPPPMSVTSKNNTKQQNILMTTQQTDIGLLSSVTGTQLTPTTSGLIQTTETPVTTISSLLSATSLTASGATGDNGISSSSGGTASIINLNSGTKIGSRKGILYYQQQQQQQNQHQQQNHYPDLDLDAIEICNEHDIIIGGAMEPKQSSSSSSSIKALLRNKNTGNNIIGNIRQYNYNNISTNNSTNNNNNKIGTCDSSNSSIITTNFDNNHSSTLENTNVKWSRNIPLNSIDDFQHQQQQQQQEHEQQTSSSLSPIISAQLHPIEIAVNPSGFGGIIHHPYHQDYSYAYYEPGAAMRHSNIPQPEQISNNSSGQSNRPPPPPNSIRALLSKGKKNKLLVSPATRQSYQTKFNQHHQENFYEEISNETAARINISSGNNVSSGGGGNLQNPSLCGIINTSIGNHSMVEEEFLRVQNHHHKILGELNLSVEAMLMPDSIQTNENNSSIIINDDLNKFITSKKFPSSNSIKTTLKSTSSTSSSIKSKNSVDNLVDLMNTIGPSSITDNCDLLSPLTCELNQTSLSIPSSQSTLLQTTNLGFCGDLDSGFSGSSGASYIGSLRYHKTNAALSNLMTSRKTTILQPSSTLHQNDIQNFDNNSTINNSNNNCNNEQQNQFNLHQDNDNMINLNNLDDTFSANSSCRSSQRSGGGGGVGCDLNSGISGGIDTCSGNNSGFIIRSSHTGKKILNFSKLKAMEDQQQIQQQTKTESNARSFWNRKGYKKSPGFSSTSNINQSGIIE